MTSMAGDLSLITWRGGIVWAADVSASIINQHVTKLEKIFMCHNSPELIDLLLRGRRKSNSDCSVYKPMRLPVGTNDTRNKYCLCVKEHD